MTQARLEELGREAVARWGLLSVRIIHRVGSFVPGDRIVFVATAARHRTEALESCAFLIDWLKTSAPFWKRERFADGRNHWVEARREDDERADGWRQHCSVERSDEDRPLFPDQLARATGQASRRERVGQ